MKRIISVLAFVLCVLLLFSCEETDEGAKVGELDEGAKVVGEPDADGYYTKGTVAGGFSWSLDAEGILKITIEEDNKEKQIDASNADYLKAIDSLRDKVTHMEIDCFGGRISYSADSAIAAVGNGARNLCASMPNLISVHFVGDNQNLWVEGNGEDVCGLFWGSSSLKTVWFGDEKTENLIDLSGVGYGTPSTKDNYFSKSLFSGCASIEKVILPSQVTEITENTFKGCASLTDVTLGTGVNSIGANAFADCKALKTLLMQSSGYSVGENAIPDNEGLAITVENKKDQLAIEKVCALTAVEFIAPLDDYWIGHIDEKLADLPSGKSFIVYTDTHFQSNMNRSTRKIADLVEYVRERTGIKTVINLGDPYSGEKTIEKADELFSTSVEEYFFDVFGTDGIFAVGNHDANYTTWTSVERATDERKQVEGENGCGAFNYVLPDTNMYNRSVAHIADVVTFDTKLIGKLESLTYNSVGVEGGEFITSEGVFEQVYYSAEDMKEQAYAWAKMHYHIDDDEQKIRYIVLDTGDCGLTTKYTLGNALWDVILPTQYDWLAETLMSTPDGYDIAVVGHMLSYYEKGASNNKEVYQMLSAFRSGEIVSFDVTAKNENMAILVGDTYKQYDFTKCGFDGVVFTMSGHWHQDESYVWYTNDFGSYQANQTYRYGDSLPEDAVFYIGLNNDCLDSVYDNQDPIMSRGNATENCFTIVTIDDRGTIFLTRIGAGDDRIFSYYS